MNPIEKLQHLDNSIMLRIGQANKEAHIGLFVLHRWREKVREAIADVKILQEKTKSLQEELDIANQIPCSLSVYDNLEKTIKNQMEIIREYYEHNKNNMQICGLNYRAKQALKGDNIKLQDEADAQARG